MVPHPDQPRSAVPPAGTGELPVVRIGRAVRVPARPGAAGARARDWRRGRRSRRPAPPPEDRSGVRWRERFADGIPAGIPSPVASELRASELRVTSRDGRPARAPDRRGRVRCPPNPKVTEELSGPAACAPYQRSGPARRSRLRPPRHVRRRRTCPGSCWSLTGPAYCRRDGIGNATGIPARAGTTSPVDDAARPDDGGRR
jgi:hypothetical protein